MPTTGVPKSRIVHIIRKVQLKSIVVALIMTPGAHHITSMEGVEGWIDTAHMITIDADCPINAKFILRNGDSWLVNDRFSTKQKYDIMPLPLWKAMMEKRRCDFSHLSIWKVPINHHRLAILTTQHIWRHINSTWWFNSSKQMNVFDF